MAEEISERLLEKIMGWTTPEDVSSEYPALRALAEFGYDDYQQFRPGMRFMESLALWLREFPSNKRRAAYDFVKNKVLYITRPQMEHVVSTAYHDFVIPKLIEQVSDESTPEWKIKNLFKSKKYEILHNQTLFLGLSDGAHIDEFRRSNPCINHEQVLRTHEISEKRADKMILKLNERLNKLQNCKNKKQFQNIFLLDDFSASGITYFRSDPDDPDDKGKIGTFLDSIGTLNDPLHKLVDQNNPHIYLILYFATKTAIDHIEKFRQKHFRGIDFCVIPIQTITEDIKFDDTQDNDFSELVKQEKYGWEEIIDDHMKKGNCDKPYLGFDGGGLPLIMYHNTPNNSLPILWRNDSKTCFKGLFPRIDRHK